MFHFLAKSSFPCEEFISRALMCGTKAAKTLEQAQIIAREGAGPFVIKVLALFDGENRRAFLAFATEAEARDIWVICGEALFFDQKAPSNVN